jgi:hypothetical protein
MPNGGAGREPVCAAVGRSFTVNNTIPAPVAATSLPAIVTAVSAELHDRADQLTESAREHDDLKAVTVLVGYSELNPGQVVIWWPVSGGIEAAYDPAQISLAAAEIRLRAQLAEHGMRVSEFLNEAPCTKYDWCSGTGPHDDHIGHGHDVPSREGEEPLIIAGLLHLRGEQLHVSIGDVPCTAAEARVKAQGLRGLADAVDAMADQVDAADAQPREDRA